jgi:hypothetical protein
MRQCNSTNHKLEKLHPQAWSPPSARASSVVLSTILLLTPDIEIGLTWSSDKDLVCLAFRLSLHDTDRAFCANNFILIDRLAAPAGPPRETGSQIGRVFARLGEAAGSGPYRELK